MAGDRLRVTKGPASGQTLPIGDGIVLGRSSTGAGAIGGDPEISREHARIAQGQFDQLVIEDLGSTNGTYVNGERIAAQRVLRPGDTVQLGRSALTVEADEQRAATVAGAAAPPFVAPVPAAAPPPPAAAPAASSPPTAPQPVAYGGPPPAGGFAGSPVQPRGPIGAQGVGGPGAAGGYGAPPFQRKKRKTGRLIAAAVVALVLVGGAVAAVLLLGGDDDSGSSSPAQASPQREAPARPAFDVAALESSLQSSLSTAGTSISTVECPPVESPRAGTSFDCDVSGDGVRGTVTVTLDSADGEAYSYKGTLRGNGITTEVEGSSR